MSTLFLRKVSGIRQSFFIARGMAKCYNAFGNRLAEIMKSTSAEAFLKNDILRIYWIFCKSSSVKLRKNRLLEEMI
jgi:hypothetical protein